MNMLSQNDISNLERNENFIGSVTELYGANNSLDYQVDRYGELYDIHRASYGKDVLFFSSPGRIEICGNHTDHNNGKVLCASISVDTVACVTPNDENKIVIDSLGFSPVSICLNDLEPKKIEEGASESLVRGVCKYFVDHGYAIGGFYATTTSDVFKGAGVSSSACFEVLVAEILNVIYNNSTITPMEKAFASQYAENVYFGKPCGLMDQSAIAFGGVSYIDFKDVASPEVKCIPWRFDKMEIVLVNCGGDHCNLTAEYAAIRREMELVASYFDQPKLRFVDSKLFKEKLKFIQKRLSGRAVLRAMHFFDENIRVDKCAKAILNRNTKTFNELINESGISSYTMLQNCFPSGDTEQRIPLALAIAKSTKGVLSCRIHGGGFAGTMISYTTAKKAQSFADKMSRIFGAECVYRIKVRNTGACQVNI